MRGVACAVVRRLLAVLACALLVAACRRAPSTAKKGTAFRADDGGQVVADLYGEKNGDAYGVVLVPGAQFDRGSWKPLAERLAATRHTVLAIDVRGGKGDSTPGSAPDERWQDPLAAVHWLHRRGAVHVAVVGASAGGALAVEAVQHAAPGEVDRLVLLSPAAVPSPERLALPTLFVLSVDEPLAPRIRAAFAAKPEPKQLLALPGDAHAQHVFDGPQAAACTDAVLAFLTPPR
jgi:pimeloyl-ACP methyl ester carboxylesterase